MIPLLKNVDKRVLDNGLSVFLRSTERVPLCCILAWVNAGYYDEPDDRTGISHFLEHILFKGSENLAPGQLAREVRGLGGYVNGGTIYDHTYYYILVPTEGVERAIELMADMLMRPVFDPEEVEREKAVVIEESRRKFDNPGVYSWEKLIGTAFTSHRIRRWRMGHEEVLRSITPDQLAAFHRRYYVPSNMYVAVAGDMDSGRIFQQIKKLFGQYPPGEPCRIDGRRVEPLPEKEPPQDELRYLEVLSDIRRSYLKIGFHAPDVFDPSYPAARLLAHVLGRGRTSRLFHTLRERKQLVDTVTAGLYADAEVGFFSIEAVLDQRNLDDAQREIKAVLDSFTHSEINEAELEKAKNVLVTHLFLDQENLLGQTYPLCYFESLGDYRLLGDGFKALLDVKPSEVLEVAKKILRPANASIVESIPGGRGERVNPQRRMRLKEIWESPPVVDKDLSEQRLKWPAVYAHPDILTAVPPPSGGKMSRSVEKIVLSSGVPLLYLNHSDIPVVTFACYFRGGRCRERPDQAGITNMMLATSVKGTSSYKRDDIFLAMEGRGTSIRFEATADLFGYSLMLLGRHFKDALPVLSDVILCPTFPTEEFLKEQEMTLSLVNRRRDDMLHYPLELLYRALFGAHPYGYSRFGTERTIRDLTSQHLLEWHSSQCVAENMTLVVVGDILKEEAVSLADRYFASRVAKGRVGGDVVPLVMKRGGERVLVERRQKAQTAVAVGFETVDMKHPDVYALELIQNILGGHGGRLFESIRERRGLAYTVTSYNIVLQSSGAFVLYAATDPSQEEDVRRALDEEIEILCDRGVTEEELAAAVSYTIGSHRIALQNSQAVAFEHLRNFMCGLGLSEIDDFEKKIKNVEPSDIVEAARRYFRPERRADGIVRGGVN